MKREDKELLLKDLCARLPYGVICQMEDKLIINDSPFYDYILSERSIDLFRNHKDFYIKPYLRPMSSMTEEEADEFEKITEDLLEYGNSTGIWNTVINWLNAKHFDHNGKYDEKEGKWKSMIEMGLALPAPEGMYN